LSGVNDTILGFVALGGSHLLQETPFRRSVKNMLNHASLSQII
jgi:hypothetical protein